MTQKTIGFIASTLVAFALSGGVAFAQTNVADSAPQDAPSMAAQAALQQASNGSCNQTCMNVIKAYGDQLTLNRVNDLTLRGTHIQAMVRLSASQKATLTASVQTNSNAMNALKAKIDADTDVATLVADVRSITRDYRIYLLVMPQLRATATMYRVQTIYDMRVELAAHLQTRIDQATSTTIKANAQAALNDMKAKNADAKAQAEAAFAEVVNLTPDNGVQARLDSNNARVTDAKNKLVVAEADSAIAQTDIATIRNLLKP